MHNDDTRKPKSPKEGRIKIGIESNVPGKEILPEIDFEDVLVFVKKYRNGTYKRIDSARFLLEYNNRGTCDWNGSTYKRTASAIKPLSERQP